MNDSGPGDAQDSERPRIGLLLSGLGDLAGGGGTERGFADIFENYEVDRARRFDLLLLTDARSREALSRAGRLTRIDSTRTLPPPTGLLGKFLHAHELSAMCRRERIDLLHVALPSVKYLPSLWWLKLRSRDQCPLVSITATDCTIAHSMFDRRYRPGSDARRARWLYRAYFRLLKLDGVYAWYRLLAERLRVRPPLGNPTIEAARCCFIDTTRFRPAEKRRRAVVWAARLEPTKRPRLFLQAVRRALDLDEKLVSAWEFYMYGQGPMRSAITQELERLRLSKLVTLDYGADMGSTFAASRLFVSTQDLENFTSMSMLEAMACGNAVLAQDVGQTRSYVQPETNGRLSASADPQEFGRLLCDLLSAPDRLDAMGRESRRLAAEQHNFPSFLAHLDDYWQRVLTRSRPRPAEAGHPA